MTKLLLKFASILCVSGLFLAAAFQTQNLGSTIRVYAVPDGAGFSVDGQEYIHAMTAIWPAGSKHTLSVTNTFQVGPNIRYLFKGWSYPGGVLPGGNNQTVTASPFVSEYRADFTVQYSLSISFFECPDPKYCPSPGTIYVNGGPINSDQILYMEANAAAELMAVPNPGYVFTGWAPGPNQVIQGFSNKVTMTTPMVVRPQFQLARKIQFNTVPDGLELLADRTRITAPTTLEWGWDTTHNVAMTSPQMDRFGRWWSFVSWSDGGALSHNYTVASSPQPATLTATFTQAAVTQIDTVPTGLAIKVDGRENWASYNFIWAPGEKHKLEAPMQQTSADGRVWKFAGWSTGAPAAHDYTVPASTVPGGARVTAKYTAVATMQVSSTLAGVQIAVDGVECQVPCQVTRDEGETVRVSAPPSVALGDGVRGDFTGWPGSGSTATEGTYTLTATPMKLVLEYRLMNRLQASSNPPEGVTWRVEPASQDGFYDSFSTVNVSVSPRPGFRFKRWSGDLSGSAPYGALSMNAPRAVEAMLERIPFVSQSGVANAASGSTEAGVTPGSVASIFGASLAAGTEVGPDSPLAQTLGGVSVRVGERFLPLFFVSPAQINVQVPPELPEGDQTLVINSVGMPDVQAPIKVVRNAPGLFQAVTDGDAFAVAAHPDGSPVTADAPAHPGEVITLFGTGFGPTDRPRPTGFAVPASPPASVVDPALIRTGDLSIPADKAYAVPGRVGVDGVDFRVPDGAAPGNLKLSLSVNERESNVVLLRVQPK